MPEKVLLFVADSIRQPLFFNCHFPWERRKDLSKEGQTCNRTGVYKIDQNNNSKMLIENQNGNIKMQTYIANMNPSGVISPQPHNLLFTIKTWNKEILHKRVRDKTYSRTSFTHSHRSHISLFHEDLIKYKTKWTTKSLFINKCCLCIHSLINIPLSQSLELLMNLSHSIPLC